MVREQINEIIRIKNLMGFNTNPLIESRNLIKKILINEAVATGGPRQEMVELMRKFFLYSNEDAAQYYKTLSEEEKIYMREIIDAQNELGGRITGDLTDPFVVASLRRALTDSGDDLKKVLAKATRNIERRLVGLNIQNLLTMDGDLATLLRTVELSKNVQINNKNATLLDLLSVIEKSGGVKKSTIFDSNPEMWGILAQDLNKVSDSAPDNVKKYLADIQEEIFEKNDPDAYVDVIAREEDEIMALIDDAEFTLLKRDLEEPIKIDFDIEDVSTNTDIPLDQKQKAQKKFQQLLVGCDTRACRVLNNIAKNNPEKYNKFWNNIENEFLNKIKLGEQFQPLRGTITNTAQVLKKLEGGAGSGRALTESDIDEISSAVFEDIKKSGNWFFNTKSFMGWNAYMSNGEWASTLKSLLFGQSLNTGKFGTYKDMLKRWAAFNTLIFTIQFANKVREYNEGPKVGETSGELLLRLGYDTAADMVGGGFFGAAPILRIGYETAVKIIDVMIEDYSYVSEPDLKKYLRDSYGWTDIVMDQFIFHPVDNKAYVSYFQNPTDNTSPRTVISGITVTPYDSSNGVYTTDRTSGLSKIVFVKEGSKAPLVTQQKISTDDVDKVKTMLYEKSVISKYIKKKVLATDIKYEGETKITKDGKEMTMLKFSYTNTSEVDMILIFSYDEWVNANKPDLTTDLLFDQFCRFES
jgi:hypothetical protein